MEPEARISAAMRALRPGDLADIDVDLATGALTNIHDLEGAPAIASDIASIRRRLDAIGVLNDDADVGGSAWSAEDGAVGSGGGDFEIPLKIHALATRAAFGNGGDIGDFKQAAPGHAARFVGLPVAGTPGGDGFRRCGGW